MDYKEYEKIVFENFRSSVLTSNSELKEKIFNYLVFWYNNICKDKLIEYFDNKEFDKIVSITYKLNYLCGLSDLDKIKYIYKDDSIDDFNKLSNEIFELATKALDDANFSISNSEYDDYVSRINSLSENINEIYKNLVDIEISECMLDLNFLLNRKEVFSSRLIDYRNKQFTDKKKVTN